MKILVCCAGGMSSSLLVRRMRDEVKKQHLDNIKIGSCGRNELYRYIDEADVILLAPQLTFMKENLSAKHKLMEISYEDYGNLDAVAILKKAINFETTTKDLNLKGGHKVMVKVADKIAQSYALTAISQGFSSIMPISVLGSLFILLKNIPLVGYSEFLNNSGLDYLLSLASGATIDAISIYACFFITFRYVQLHHLQAHQAGLLSLICFFLLIGNNEQGYLIDYINSRGLFTAIFVSISVGYLYVLLSDKKIELKKISFINKSLAFELEKLVPSLFITLIFLSIACLILLTPYPNLHMLIYETIQTSLMSFMGNNLWSFLILQLMTNVLWFFGLHGGNIVSSVTKLIYETIQTSLMSFMGNNLWSFLILQLMTNVLWFFGLHGGNIVSSVTNAIMISLSLENFSLYQSGQMPINIISNDFSKCYIAGGVGSLFSLTILMTFLSKSKRYKTLGKLSLPTTFFFINEPLMFGIPVVLNPTLFIPLVFITPILAVFTYCMMAMHIVPIPIGIQLPWTTPPVFYGFLQGSYKIALLEVVNIILAGLMWYPFFKKMDHHAYLQETKECHN